MICLCTCAGGSASSPVNRKQGEGSKSCKSCGGKLPGDEQGALSGSMLSTVGLELSRVINPHLNWKTTSKGRHRAVRRARRSAFKNLSGREDLTDKESKGMGEMAVSESEKLGVTILGRRFSNTLESVPIKKRRLLLVRSPSPPPQLSSHTDDSADIQERQPSFCEEDASHKKCLALDLGNSGNRMKSHQDKSADSDKTNLQELDEKLCDTADFSGISILAAAACESNMGGDAMNTEGTASRKLSQVEKEEIHRMEDIDGKANLPLKASPSSVLPSKKSDGNKLDGPVILNNSGSVDNVPNKTSGVKSSSRDDRLHWDLNTVMDAWENHDDEVLNSEPLGTNIIGQEVTQGTNLGIVEPHKDPMVSGDTKFSPGLVYSSDLGDAQEDDHVAEEAKVEENSVFSGGNSVAHENQKQDSSLLHGNGLSQEGHEFEDASLPTVDASEGTKPFCRERKCNFSAGFVSSPAGGLVTFRDSSLIAGAPKEKTCIISLEADLYSSPLVPCQKASFEVTSADNSLSAPDRSATFVYVEKIVEESAADFEGPAAHSCLTNIDTRQSTSLSSPQAENHASLQADFGNDMIKQCSAVTHLAENVTETMVDGGTNNNMMNTDGIDGESTCFNAFAETQCESTNKLKGENMSSLPSDSHAFDSHVLHNQDMLSSGEVCANRHGTTDSCMKMCDRCSVLTDENLNTTKVDSPAHINSDAPVYNSASVKDGVLDVPSLDGPLNSHGNVTSFVQIGLQDHSQFDDYSDVSQSDIDQATGMEKIEFLGDDDYQYEDGEFRESFVNYWAEDGVDDGETEHLDYGSDSREMDIIDSNSDIPSVPLYGAVGARTGRLPDTNQDYKNGALVGKETQLAVSQSLIKCSFFKDVSDTDSARKGLKDVDKKMEGDAKDISESASVSDNVRRDGEFINKEDDSRKSSYRMKFSGWDQLPEGSKGLVGGVVGSGVGAVSQNHTDASFNASFSARSSVGRDLPSQTERLNSSDVPNRKDKSARRCNNHNDLDSRVQRDMAAPRSIGRGGSSKHNHGRGKQDAWVDSPGRRGSNHHDSRDCYDPTSMPHPVPRNAAEAAVVRLKNSGYVVSSNGTILKAGSIGPAGGVPRRAETSSLHSAYRSLVKRRSSIERDGSIGMQLGLNSSIEEIPDRHLGASAGRYAHGMVITSQKERYHGPMPDNNRDTPLSLCHGLSRGGQSFSPSRKLLHRSRTRSPSRSRTRSPHLCTSPRGKTDRVMKAPSLRTHRSPNFKPEVRIQRLRSPQRRSGLVEHMIDYAPSSRNQNSPPHSSRWFDERKDFTDHFREHEKNRLSDRSSPRRVFSRSRRIDAVDAPGRDKSDEYYRSMHSGNFHGFVDFDRECRYDGAGSERRVYGNRYEMLQPTKQYATDGNMKRFPAEHQEGFRGNHPQSRTCGFQRRGSPRGFDRGDESQLGDSCRGVKEEKSNVRYGRDGRHDAGFTSFGDTDSSIDGALQRRRPT